MFTSDLASLEYTPIYRTRQSEKMGKGHLNSCFISAIKKKVLYHQERAVDTFSNQTEVMALDVLQITSHAAIARDCPLRVPFFLELAGHVRLEDFGAQSLGSM